ncbi:MAG: type II secretion system protein GspC [Gammaproteobacteria bacterium]|nr:MAG: type II secretion system protein GspC [Gammaproteobacteria bacterium]
MTTKAKWSDLLSGDSSRTLAAVNGLLPAWVSLVIVVLIGWQLAKIIWSFVPGTDVGTPVIVPLGQNTAVAMNDSAHVQSIANVHIFGEADAADEPILVAAETDNLPDTDLQNLTLKGTYTAESADMSIAIIADGNNKEDIFSIGETVASGATLHAVHVDRVVLNERGELTNLAMPREYAKTTPRTSARRTPTVRTQSIQSVVAKNVSRLADIIRPTPYFQNGQQQGYRVYPGRDRKKFAALGLRPGDLIKQIDGQSLTDPTQAMQIFQSLGTANQVSVTVERNGIQQTLILRTEQLDIGQAQTE